MGRVDREVRVGLKSSCADKLMRKIEELIKQLGLRPSDCAYHTWRKIKDEKTGKEGEIRVLVVKGSESAHVEYRCPACGHESYLTKPWRRPFSVRCEKCNYLIRVPRLRDEIKRKRRSGRG